MAQDRDTQPHWYVAHTYSGYENKVRQDLETIVENRRLQDLIQEVRVPTETVVDADGKAVLRVADDGPGIAPEDQDKVWQRFWQADPSRGEDGGSGLGLAMVKEIVQLHGGSVGLESAPGKGSIFSVTL